MSSTYAQRRFCDGNSTYAAEEIVSILLAVFVFIGAAAFLAYLIKQWENFKRRYKLTLKWLLVMALVSLCLFCISSILVPILCHSINERIAMVAVAFALLFYFAMMLNLLGSLIARLFLTFDHSAYEISKCKRLTVWILFGSVALMFTVSIILYVADIITGNDVSTAVSLASIGFLVYMVCSAFVTFLFAQNMLQLTNTRANTIRNANLQELAGRKSQCEINDKQTQLIDNTSRYTSLFTMALLSSFLAGLSPYVVEVIPSLFDGRFIYLILIFGSIDSSTNIVCLAMQYTFASRIYNAHCRWIECCWKACFMRSTYRAMDKKYKEMINLQRAAMTSESEAAANSLDKTQDAAAAIDAL